MKRDILVLFMSYENYIDDLHVEGDKVYLVLKSQNRILYDDKEEKTFDEKLNNADLQDSLEQIYPLNQINGVMEENFDPGRFRNYELLKEVYGDSENSVKENLGNIVFGENTYYFSQRNNALYYLKLLSNKT